MTERQNAHYFDHQIGELLGSVELADLVWAIGYGGQSGRLGGQRIDIDAEAITVPPSGNALVGDREAMRP
jgi:hypothetical protein